jgi:hypothetical protein
VILALDEDVVPLVEGSPKRSVMNWSTDVWVEPERPMLPQILALTCCKEMTSDGWFWGGLQNGAV